MLGLDDARDDDRRFGARRLLEPLARSYDRHTLIKRADTPEAQRTRIEFGRFTANNALMGAVALVLRRQGRLG